MILSISSRPSFRDALANHRTDLLDKAGEFVHAMSYRAGSYEHRTPLIREIRQEGVEL